MKLATTNILAAALAVATFAGTASAAVKREGDWPATETAVSLDATNLPVDEAIKRLADAAGWSVMVKAQPTGNDLLTLHLKNQPPSKVLDLILSNGNYVAKRDGTMVSIERASAADDESASDDDVKNAKSIASRLFLSAAIWSSTILIIAASG